MSMRRVKGEHNEHDERTMIRQLAYNNLCRGSRPVLPPTYRAYYIYLCFWHPSLFWRAPKPEEALSRERGGGGGQRSREGAGGTVPPFFKFSKCVPFYIGKVPLLICRSDLPLFISYKCPFYFDRCPFSLLISAPLHL